MPLYRIKGNDRQAGALGRPDVFEDTIQASSPLEAQVKALKKRYAAGREHVHVAAQNVTEIKGVVS